jgi:hypothetical protein
MASQLEDRYDERIAGVLSSYDRIVITGSVPAAEALRAVAALLRGPVTNAEPLTDLQRWREILSRAFQAFLKGRPLRVPPPLKPG